MKIGLCTGCFDKFHDGHRYFLEQAAKHCDYLVVAVNDDISVCELKGKDRPNDPWDLRMLNVANCVLALDASPAVSIIPFSGHGWDLVKALLPDVIIRGWDQTPGENFLSIPIVRIAKGPNVSTSSLA